jgi:hypothetical protein
MKLRTCAWGLLVGAMSVIGLAGGTGVAHADADPFGQPGPGVLDQLLTSTPVLFINPSDEGGPSVDSGAVGMVCQNLFARCS